MFVNRVRIAYSVARGIDNSMVSIRIADTESDAPYYPLILSSK